MELKVPMCGRSFESTLFLASHEEEVIRPELRYVECIMDLGDCFSVLICMLYNVLPVTVAERSKACTLFARLKPGSWVRIPLRALLFDVCVGFCVFVLSCV
jgi:hypothetical protein